MVCLICSKPLKSHNKCGACYIHKHLSPKIKDYQFKKRIETKDARATYSVQYREKNRTSLLREKREWSKEYRLAFPEKHRERSRKRNLSILRATPPWLTKGQRQEIKEWHSLAKELQWLSEEKLTVDHIIPIGGKNVSGLHVPWNLQILPHSSNCSKSIRMVG